MSTRPEPHAGQSAALLAPTRRLDPRSVLAAVNDATDAGLRFVGRALGGEVGAGYVRWPDGQDGVLTWQPGRSPEALARLRLTADVLSYARTRGLPVPAYDLIVELPVLDAIAVVQERLPGVVADHRGLDGRVVAAMVAVNERFAGLLADRPEVPAPELYLLTSGPGFCVHESLRRHSARTRRLLGWVHEVGRGWDGMVGDDLVHLDFHPGNVLVDGTGAVTGIVDWDGIGRGDRRFALVTLRFAVAYDGVTGAGEPAQVAWLDGLLGQADADRVRAYWAHMSLRMVDWSIRHHDAATVERWLTLAESRLD